MMEKGGERWGGGGKGGMSEDKGEPREKIQLFELLERKIESEELQTIQIVVADGHV